ncbi:putative gag-pol polyprotein [Cucumis melo var. makuwa]|uniref:Gag-pol polyprotein n=1 Tax=Cucumis melo var. makuwa TaxID=1194695 RepID=A0A5A7UI68_CUCMM|nr:putative gag-pol polyprotein [Cucumis melo var. makuwa]
MARVMIHAKSLPIHFWTEDVNTTCHIHNRVALRPGTTVMNYQLWKERKLNIKYLHVFGFKCYILNDREYHQKWDSKSDEGIFLGNSVRSKAYKVYKKGTRMVIESINVRISDTENPTSQSISDNEETHDTNLPTSERCLPVDPLATSTNNDVNTKLSAPLANVKKNHTVSNVIGEIDIGIVKRKNTKPDYAKMIANAKAKCTPVATQIKMSIDDGGKKVNESLYRSIIGKPILCLLAIVMSIGLGVLVIGRVPQMGAKDLNHQNRKFGTPTALQADVGESSKKAKKNRMYTAEAVYCQIFYSDQDMHNTGRLSASRCSTTPPVNVDQSGDRTTEVPPPQPTNQNVNDGPIPSIESPRHGFKPPS